MLNKATIVMAGLALMSVSCLADVHAAGRLVRFGEIDEFSPRLSRDQLVFVASRKCIRRYVGRWTWTWQRGYTIIYANGTAKPHCANCVPLQKWSCRGNIFTFRNVGSPGSWTMRLSPDGRKLIGSWGTAVKQ